MTMMMMMIITACWESFPRIFIETTAVLVV